MRTLLVVIALTLAASTAQATQITVNAAGTVEVLALDWKPSGPPNNRSVSKMAQSPLISSCSWTSIL